MKLLEERILSDARVLPGDILKVDNFLNHQVDPKLIMALGKDFYDYFKDKNITKVLTLEVSGITIAMAAAYYLDVNMVFAKKIESKTLSEDVYSSKVISYTKKREYDIRVDKKFLNKDDNVLIIDDFLANGKALEGLVDLCDQAGANVAGIGITIEKTFQPGGKMIREKGYDVYSQAQIKIEGDKVIFE